MNNPALVFLSEDRTGFTVRRDHEFIFINAGNRAVAVNRIYLQITQLKTDGDNFDAQCKTGLSERLYFEIKPFVVKSGEIISKEAVAYVRLTTDLHGGSMNAPLAEMPDADIPAQGTNKQAKEKRIQVCIGVGLTTPDADYDITTEQYSHTFEASGADYVPFAPNERPSTQILKQNSIISLH